MDLLVLFLNMAYHLRLIHLVGLILLVQHPSHTPATSGRASASPRGCATPCRYAVGLSWYWQRAARFSAVYDVGNSHAAAVRALGVWWAREPLILRRSREACSSRVCCRAWIRDTVGGVDIVCEGSVVANVGGGLEGVGRGERGEMGARGVADVQAADAREMDWFRIEAGTVAWSDSGCVTRRGRAATRLCAGVDGRMWIRVLRTGRS